MLDLDQVSLGVKQKMAGFTSNFRKLQSHESTGYKILIVFQWDWKIHGIFFAGFCSMGFSMDYISPCDISRGL